MAYEFKNPKVATATRNMLKRTYQLSALADQLSKLLGPVSVPQTPRFPSIEMTAVGEEDSVFIELPEKIKGYVPGPPTVRCPFCDHELKVNLSM